MIIIIIYLTYTIYITYPLLFHQLIYMTCIIYNAYMPYIIIYIAASLHHLPLQTYLTLHHLQDLQHHPHHLQYT